MPRPVVVGSEVADCGHRRRHHVGARHRPRDIRRGPCVVEGRGRREGSPLVTRVRSRHPPVAGMWRVPAASSGRAGTRPGAMPPTLAGASPSVRISRRATSASGMSVIASALQRHRRLPGFQPAGTADQPAADDRTRRRRDQRHGTDQQGRVARRQAVRAREQRRQPAADRLRQDHGPHRDQERRQERRPVDAGQFGRRGRRDGAAGRQHEHGGDVGQRGGEEQPAPRGEAAARRDPGQEGQQQTDRQQRAAAPERGTDQNRPSQPARISGPAAAINRATATGTKMP